MIRLAIYTLAVGILGALIGAIGVYMLADGLPEGAVMGGILGGSIGMLIGARLDARRTEKSLAKTDPGAATRSAALMSARRQQIRQFEYDRSGSPASAHMLKKIEDQASAAEPKRGGKL